MQIYYIKLHIQYKKEQNDKAVFVNSQVSYDK